jgi:hypothetical protein
MAKAKKAPVKEDSSSSDSSSDSEAEAPVVVAKKAVKATPAKASKKAATPAKKEESSSSSSDSSSEDEAPAPIAKKASLCCVSPRSPCKSLLLCGSALAVQLGMYSVLSLTLPDSHSSLC